MKSTAVVIGLLVGCIIAGATGYFDRSSIDAAPAVSFIWVYTFKLSVYGPIVLPLLAVYMVLAMEAIGDITATCDVSKLGKCHSKCCAKASRGLRGSVAYTIQHPRCLRDILLVG